MASRGEEGSSAGTMGVTVMARGADRCIHLFAQGVSLRTRAYEDVEARQLVSAVPCQSSS